MKLLLVAMLLLLSTSVIANDSTQSTAIYASDAMVFDGEIQDINSDIKTSVDEDWGKQNYDNLILRNACFKTIIAAVRYLGVDGLWKTRGWYRIAPGAAGVVGQTRNRVFYTTGQSADGTLSWAGTATYVNIGGVVYGFRGHRITTSQWGNWTLNFTCN